MKHLISFFVTLLVCLTASAEELTYTYEGQTLTYTILDEEAMTCEVKAGYRDDTGTYYSGNDVSGDLIIPETVNNGRFSYTVTSIGDYALSNCTGLTSVDIPESMTNIGSGAFFGCSSLTSVNIHDIAAWCNIIFNSSAANPLNYAHNLKLDGQPITNLVIPNSVTSIGSWAFRRCTGLTSVEIPNSVTAIGNGAFDGCSGLTSVAIPESVASIGSSAFQFCSGLTWVNIPKSVTSIGSSTFNGCSGLTSVAIPESVTSIGWGAFWDCSGLKSIDIPDLVEAVEYRAFSGCSSLSTVIIGSGVTTIGSAAFAGCPLDTIFAHPTTAPKIEDANAFDEAVYQNAMLIYHSGEDVDATYADKDNEWWRFENYRQMDNLVILNYEYHDDNTATVTGITGGRTSSTFEIIIPETTWNNGQEYTVTAIGESAFRNCDNLTYVSIPNTVTTIGLYAFLECRDLTYVYIPNSVTTIGMDAFFECKRLTSVVIPESVTSIGDYAFFSCDKLALVKIPNSVTAIGEGVFYMCSSLTSVTIPNSVTSIGMYAFRYCSSLRDITIGAGVKTIGGFAFENCPLETVRALPLQAPVVADANAFDESTYQNATLIINLGEDVAASYADESNVWWRFENRKQEDPFAPSISLLQTSVDINIGQTMQLNATVENIDSPVLLWSSLNPDVATVDSNGLVTAVAAGETDICVTPEGCPELKATCHVTVTGESDYIESLRNDLNADMPVEIYTASGRKVYSGLPGNASLEKGVYIVRQGSTMTKIMMK